MMPATNNNKWINPIGGLGDMLMLSGVLKRAVEINPDTRYNLVQRTKYNDFFMSHPAIATIGCPPPDAVIIEVNYWSIEKLGPAAQRPYQILSRIFGLPTPQAEVLFYPGSVEKNDILFDKIPWKTKNVLIAPGSDSPRKILNPFAWQHIIEQIKNENTFILQAGKQQEILIKGAYSLLGLTGINQLIPVVDKADLILTSDNFIMHLAYMLNKKAIVIWGPTDHEIYGYKNHIHFQAPTQQCPDNNRCIGGEYPQNYAKPCPFQQEHCLNKIEVKDIIYRAKEVIL